MLAVTERSWHDPVLSLIRNLHGLEIALHGVIVLDDHNLGPVLGFRIEELRLKVSITQAVRYNAHLQDRARLDHQHITGFHTNHNGVPILQVEDIAICEIRCATWQAEANFPIVIGFESLDALDQVLAWDGDGFQVGSIGERRIVDIPLKLGDEHNASFVVEENNGDRTGPG